MDQKAHIKRLKDEETTAERIEREREMYLNRLRRERKIEEMFWKVFVVSLAVCALLLAQAFLLGLFSFDYAFGYQNYLENEIQQCSQDFQEDFCDEQIVSLIGPSPYWYQSLYSLFFGARIKGPEVTQAVARRFDRHLPDTPQQDVEYFIKYYWRNQTFQIRPYIKSITKEVPELANSGNHATFNLKNGRVKTITIGSNEYKLKEIKAGSFREEAEIINANYGPQKGFLETTTHSKKD